MADEGVLRRLTAAGAAFEVVDEPVLGVSMSVFRNRPRSAGELLLAAQRHGDADYVVFGATRVSYAQQVAAATALAQALHDDFGVRKGDRVAIVAANCPQWITAFWAATSIGAVVASMNAWWAAPEAEHALAMCEPTVVLVDAKRRPLAEQLAARVGFTVLDIESDVDAIVATGQGSAELPPVSIDEDDPAVILYTSGTTGRSKGAVASHRSLCGAVSVNQFSAVAAAAAAGVDLTAAGAPSIRQVTLVTVPLFHASGLYGFVVSQLAFGGTIVLRPGRFDEDDVLRLIEAERVTMWAALGSMGPRVAERSVSSARDLSSMRTIAIGGAPTSPALQAQLRTAFPNAAVNVSMGYTSSEAVAVVTRIQGADLADHPTSAGSTNITTALEIRGPDGAPVPDGVDGEIHVRSPYLMLEYWRDPDATAAVLKPGRWLAMGDIGRVHDGRLYINSRARDLILVNAENVFPTEVEYRLDAHPAVVESAVFGIDDDLTGQAIRAAVVLRTDAAVSTDDLASWCRDGIAGYKVPTQWDVRVEPLPRNASGKILKRELLPEPTESPR